MLKYWGMHPRIVRIITIFFVAIALTTLAISPSHTNAQEAYDSFAIEMTPPNPGPGQSVTIAVKSLSVDLSHADISWYQGSTLIKQGSGVSQITVTAPENNKSFIITARIKAPNGQNSTETITVKSGEIDISWEALTYVPPLYKGRSLYTNQSNLKIVALPNLRDKNGRIIPANDLVYKWTKDSTVLGNLSGYGKQTITLKGEIVARPFTITVDVSSRDGSAKGQAYINVDTLDPEIAFYIEDPLYGVLYNQALSNRFSITNEAKIAAEPYYFSTTNRNNPNLRYIWSINRLEQTNITTPDLTLRPKEGVEGSAIISLRIDNLYEIMQSTSNEISAYFSKQKTEELPTF